MKRLSPTVKVKPPPVGDGTTDSGASPSGSQRTERASLSILFDGSNGLG